MGELNIATPLLQAVDLLMSERLSELAFDKTIQARIISCEDNATGKYKVKYQDSILSAYSMQQNKRYVDNTEVYVRIPNGDFSRDNKEILGTVKKLGADYVDAVANEDRFTFIGTNVLSAAGEVGLCSYRGAQEMVLYQSGTSQSGISIDQTSAEFYAQEMVNFLMGGSFRTNLSDEQKLGQGHYGIRIKARYYNNRYNQNTVSGDATTIERTYILDVDNMTGQPYNYVLPNRQVAIFDTDGDNFIEITYVSFFCSGFPVTDTTKTEADIFFSNPEFQFIEALTEQELNGTSLKILTPNGGFFTSSGEDSIKVQAQLKVEGKILSDDEQTVKYYWFIEDIGVNGTNSPYYNSVGGLGWRCLNSYSEIDSTTRLWTALKTKYFTLTKDICTSYENRIKCVAVYGDNIKVAGTKRFYNQGAQFKVEISSSDGEHFFYDTGSTRLTAQVYQSTNSGWTPVSAAAYEWGYYDGNDTLYTINVNGNILDIDDISLITDFSIYKCTAYRDAAKTQVIGTGYIKLSNAYTTDGSYNLVINNGSQVFKYDESGLSPVSSQQEEINPISVLTFDLYDPNGKELDDKILANEVDVTWTLPAENTLLNFSGYGISHLFVDNGDGTYSFSGRGETYLTLPFGIKTKYNINSVNNEITLHIRYRTDGDNPVDLTVHTNFTFTKEGELGTNGTKYTCRIVPLNSAYDKVYLYSSNGSSANWNVGNTRYPFAVELLADEEVMFKNGGGSNMINRATKGTSSAKWSLLDKRSTAANTAAFTINENGYTTIRGYGYTNNVIKVEVSFEGQTYYATYSVESYRGAIQVTGGYRYVQYRSDGTSPQRPAAAPFTVLLNGVERKSGATYTWSKSSIFNFAFTDVKDANDRVIISEKNLLPPSSYDGLEVNNFIRIGATYNGIYYEAIIPIQLYLNRYGMAALNGWDGNSIEINNDDGYILTPQIGAGIKENDNSFTGIVMGKTMESNGSTKIGLLGYGHGENNIFLNAETGEATFGVSGNGQIILRPNGDSYIAGWKINAASLTSPDRKTTLYSGGGDNDKRVNVNNKFIIYGDGRFSAANNKFSVDADGNITATGGTIGGWHIESNQLYSGNIQLNASGSIKHKSGTWQVKQDGSAIFQNITANVTGDIAGWKINSWGLSNNGIQIRSDGAIQSSGWWINSDGSAKFNNLTATSVFTISGNNGAFSNLGFNFTGTGLGVANTGFSFAGTGLNLANAGFSLSGLGTAFSNAADLAISEAYAKMGGKNIVTRVKELSVEALNVSSSFTFQGRSVKWGNIKTVKSISIKAALHKYTFSSDWKAVTGTKDVTVVTKVDFDNKKADTTTVTVISGMTTGLSGDIVTGWGTTSDNKRGVSLSMKLDKTFSLVGSDGDEDMNTSSGD